MRYYFYIYLSIRHSEAYTILPVKSLCEKKFKSNERDLGIRLEIRRLHPCSSPTMNMKFMLKRKKKHATSVYICLSAMVETEQRSNQ